MICLPIFNFKGKTPKTQIGGTHLVVFFIFDTSELHHIEIYKSPLGISDLEFLFFYFKEVF